VIDFLGILPFEIDYYTKAEYVGHPLLDEISVKRDIDSRYISFLAGSREGEIKRLMPIFREVRGQMADDALLVIPPNFSDEKIGTLYGDIKRLLKFVGITLKVLANIRFGLLYWLWNLENLEGLGS